MEAGGQNKKAHFVSKFKIQFLCVSPGGRETQSKTSVDKGITAPSRKKIGVQKMLNNSLTLSVFSVIIISYLIESLPIEVDFLDCKHATAIPFSFCP